MHGRKLHGDQQKKHTIIHTLFVAKYSPNKGDDHQGHIHYYTTCNVCGVFWALPTPHENLANGGGEGWGLSHPTKNYK